MLSREQNLATFHRHAKGADFCIVEGAAGLFDGRDGKSEEGSTAEMAKWLGAPVVLVLDTFEIGRSAAAMLKGYQAFDSSVRLEGLLLNRIADNEQVQRLEEAVETAGISVRVLGGVFKVPPSLAGLSPFVQLIPSAAGQSFVYQSCINSPAYPLAFNVTQVDLAGELYFGGFSLREQIVKHLSHA